MLFSQKNSYPSIVFLSIANKICSLQNGCWTTLNKYCLMDIVPDFWLLMQVKDASNLLWENWNLGIYHYFVVGNLTKCLRLFFA